MGNDGSRGDLQFENNSLDSVNLNFSNGVMPLQYYTIEYQISNTEFSAATNAGPSMYCVVSTLPACTFWCMIMQS